MFVSDLQGLTLIDESNAADFARQIGPDAVSDSGFIRGQDRPPTPKPLCAVQFPKELYIPRSEWRERIEEMERKKTRPSDLLKVSGIKWLHQGRTSSCWAFGVVHAVMALRIWNNLPAVRLSPTSVSAPVNNYRDQGGWGDCALDFIVKEGIAPESLWPLNVFDRKYYSPSREEAKSYKVTEFWDCDKDFDAKASLMLRYIPVPSGYNWMGHEMCGIDLVKLDGAGRFGCVDLNSYTPDGSFDGYALSESKGTGDDQVAPRVPTAA